MSAIAEEARVELMLADFASSDAVGKLNLIGGGWQVTPPTPSGISPPFCVVVRVVVESKFAPSEVAIELELRNAAGDPVEIPGVGGEPQRVRIAQLAKLEKPNVQGISVPEELPSILQIVMNFSTGLLLPSGVYKWRFSIDGSTDPRWQLPFLIVGPPPAPIYG